MVPLPSQHTFCDYSHYYNSEAGFSDAVDEQILRADRLSTSLNYHKLVVLLIDEVHIKEGLVYNKHTGSITDLGTVNNQLLPFKLSVCEKKDSNTVVQTLATSMMFYMVRRFFSTLQFTYAQFPCSSLTGDFLFESFWEAVFRLERTGFKVSWSYNLIIWY